MRYRFVTVLGEGDCDRLAFKRALMRSSAPPVRIAESRARGEISATLLEGADMDRVQKCLRAVGFKVGFHGEMES